jgi:hypothetical protein
MTTDYRALCAELLNRLNGLYEEIIDAGVGCIPDEAQDLMNRAWEAMAQPEPEGPTKAELRQIFDDQSGFINDEQVMWWSDFQHAARTVLARWETPNLAEIRRSMGDAPQPIPVSERLPGPGDCNTDGEVWAWRRFDPEGDIDNGDHWCLAFHEWLEDEDCGFTHWLPAHALPVPTPTSENV